MGIHSDNIEQMRDKGFDPTMFIGSGGLRYGYRGEYFNSKSNSIAQNISSYHTFSNKNEIECNRLLNAIKHDLEELENIKYQHIITEKIVLRIKNSGKLECPLVDIIINEILNQCSNTYHYVNKIREEILADFDLAESKCNIKMVDEETIKESIFDTIVENLDLAIKNGLQMERSVFRKMVKDVIVLMKELFPEKYNNDNTDKKTVEMYFASHCGEKRGHVVCRSCGEMLYKSIPYCFNCYERRES